MCVRMTCVAEAAAAVAAAASSSKQAAAAAGLLREEKATLVFASRVIGGPKLQQI